MIEYPESPKNYLEIERFEIQCGLRKKEDIFTAEKTAHGLGKFSIENEKEINLKSAVLFVRVSQSKPFLKARIYQIKQTLERKAREKLTQNQLTKNL